MAAYRNFYAWKSNPFLGCLVVSLPFISFTWSRAYHLKLRFRSSAQKCFLKLQLWRLYLFHLLRPLFWKCQSFVHLTSVVPRAHLVCIVLTSLSIFFTFILHITEPFSKTSSLPFLFQHCVKFHHDIISFIAFPPWMSQLPFNLAGHLISSFSFKFTDFTHGECKAGV